MAERLEASASNVSNEVIASFALEAERAQRDIDEAAGKKRAILKRAKSAGVDTDAMLEALKIKRKDEEEALLRMRNTIRYAGVIAPNAKLTQQDLFENLDTRPVNDRMAGQMLEWDAEQNGYSTGKNGGDRAENPFETTTPAHLAWHRGWERGQRFIADEMQRGGTVKTASTRRSKQRGGRDKAAGDDSNDPRQTDLEDAG